MKLRGEVPTGWYITADIQPDESLILLTTAAESEKVRRKYNHLFLARTTYAFKVDPEGLVDEAFAPVRHEPMLRRSLEEATGGTRPDAERRKAQAERLDSLPENEWVLLADPGRVAPFRTWGSCAFDTDRGQIIYWGGGHNSYEGNDYDFYDVAEHTWISSPVISDYPEHAWNRGVNLAGVTFAGAPWVRHGRKIFAYDPVSRKVINTKRVYLTAGYDPEPLRACVPVDPEFGQGDDFEVSGYTKWVTWSYDQDTEAWDLVCSALPGLDLTVSTPHGVMAVDHNWETVRGTLNPRDRLNVVTCGGSEMVENAVYLLDVAGRQWNKLSKSGPWPQNLYELTSLAYDPRRDRLILHGGGMARDELWSFDLSSGKWVPLEPNIDIPGGRPPIASREAVYIPGEDVFLTTGFSRADESDAGVFVYQVEENTWHRKGIPAPSGREMAEIVAQRRALAYDPERALVLMVLAEGLEPLGETHVYALKYRHGKALRG